MNEQSSITGRASRRAPAAAGVGFEVRSSDIEGVGVFATRHFEPSERILRFDHDDRLGPDRPLRPDLGEREVYVDQIAGGVQVYLPAPGRHVNSSCQPSARVRWDDDECWAVALRRIQPDDEITVDYVIATHDEEPQECRCGAARCLGTIAGSVFELPDDRLREYEPLMADWFIREHAHPYRAMCDRLGIASRV